MGFLNLQGQTNLRRFYDEKEGEWVESWNVDERRRLSGA